MENMEIKIPLTNFKIGIRINKGGSTSNGNGYKTRTLSFMIISKVGNGDDGNRCCTEIPTGDPKNSGTLANLLK